MPVDVPHLTPPTEPALQELWRLLTDRPDAPTQVVDAFYAGDPMNDWRAHFVAALSGLGKGAVLDWKDDRSDAIAALERLSPGAGQGLPPPEPDDRLFEHLVAASRALRPRDVYLLMLGPPMDAFAFCLVPASRIRRAYHLCLELDLDPRSEQPPSDPQPAAPIGDFRDAGLVVDHAYRLLFDLNNGPAFKFSRERLPSQLLASIRSYTETVQPYRKRLQAMDPRARPGDIQHSVIDIGDSFDGAKLLWELRRSIQVMRDTLIAYCADKPQRAPFAALARYPYARNYTFYAHHLRGPTSMKAQWATVASRQPLPPTTDELMTMPERIHYLDLTNGRLHGVPAGVCELPELEVLLLDRNNLKSLPRGLARMTALRMLAIRVTALGPDHVAKVQQVLPECVVYWKNGGPTED